MDLYFWYSFVDHHHHHHHHHHDYMAHRVTISTCQTWMCLAAFSRQLSGFSKGIDELFEIFEIQLGNTTFAFNMDIIQLGIQLRNTTGKYNMEHYSVIPVVQSYTNAFGQFSLRGQPISLSSASSVCSLVM